jgi:sigma-B regulation protein RsbQ
VIETAPADVLRRNNVTLLGDPAGRPMLFAHGFGCSQEMWRQVADPFTRDHRVVLFDHVGSGKADLSAYDRIKYDSLEGYADDVLEIVEALDLEDVVYVGHSVSAMIGVLAAMGRPDLFGALILVGPSPRYVDAPGYRGGFSQADIDSLLDVLDANHLGWSASMAPVIAGNPDRPEIGDELTASFCSMDPTVARQFARVTFLSDNRRDLADVTTPTLILQSKEDVIAPLEVGEYVRDAIQDSEFVVLDAKGHTPNLSEPAQVVAAIRSYLTRPATQGER